MSLAAVLRVGVIGAGTAGTRHAHAYGALPDVRVTAIVDPDAVRGASLADELGARSFAEPTPQFWDGIDLVSVCPPHHLLARLALQAVEHRKPLLLEKPMALSLSEADAVIGAATAAGVPLMVGFVHRFRAEVQTAYRLLQSGFIGTPTFAVEHLISGGGSQPAWIWRRSTAGGGVVLYNGVHGLDRLRWFMGSDIVRAFAQARTVTHDADVEDVLVGTLSFASGGVASFVQHIAPFSLPPGWRSEIYGTDGGVLLGSDGQLTATDHSRTLTVAAPRDDRFLAEVQEFVAAIRNNREPSVTGADGRAALAAALAIYASAASGQPEPVANAAPRPTW